MRGLDYIPEAHNYLKIQGKRCDFTSDEININDFEADILQEIIISPTQISTFKVDFHKKFLADWLEKEKIALTLTEIWELRERCIEAISSLAD